MYVVQYFSRESQVKLIRVSFMCWIFSRTRSGLNGSMLRVAMKNAFALFVEELGPALDTEVNFSLSVENELFATCYASKLRLNVEVL